MNLTDLKTKPIEELIEIAKDMGLVRNDVSVILCGFPAMAEAAKSLYVKAGCPEDQILTNF